MWPRRPVVLVTEEDKRKTARVDPRTPEAGQAEQTGLHRENLSPNKNTHTHKHMQTQAIGWEYSSVLRVLL